MQKILRLLSVTFYVLLLSAPPSAQANPLPVPAAQTAARSVIGETDPGFGEPAVYIVRLVDEPLATYSGGDSSLASTSQTPDEQTRLDISTSASRQYRSYLADRRAQFLNAAGQALAESLEVLYSYDVAFNGLAIRATPAGAARLLEINGVAAIYRDEMRQVDTDSTVEYLGIDSVWSGGGGMPGTKGDGIIIGVIDTGIWPEHPSFADGGVYPPPPAKWHGVCQPPEDSSLVYNCTNKLIGVRYFLDGYKAAQGGQYDGLYLSGRDDVGHGTHIASVAAGNANVSASIYSIPRGEISGMAPRAYIASYKAVGPRGGTTADIVAAFDAAVTDGVDLINLSASSQHASDPWQSPDALAALAAQEAGVVVVVSAGNHGPGASSIGSPANAPWVISVGASTHNRTYVSDITLKVYSGETVINTYSYQGASITAAVTNKNLVLPAAQNASCDAAFPALTFTTNDFVLCPLGGSGPQQHADNVKAGGGGGILHYGGSTDLDAPLSLQSLPSVTVLSPAGQSILSLFDTFPGNPIKITTTQGNPVSTWITPDTVTGFSARGPAIDADSGDLINTLKPDLVAPGFHVLAGASPSYSGPGEQWQYFQITQGTSVSAAHVTGSAALLKALHPTWTPAEIKSALMLTGLTASQYERESSGDSPADPFDMGGGRILIPNAAQAGFVLDETAGDFLSANPSIGGEPAGLNQASMVEANCLDTCTWQRLIKSTQTYGITWNVTTTGLPVTVEPSSFTLAAGQTRWITITANVSGLGSGDWGFGQVRFSGAGQTLKLTLAARAADTPPSTVIQTRRSAGVTRVGPFIANATEANPASLTASVVPGDHVEFFNPPAQVFGSFYLSLAWDLPDFEPGDTYEANINIAIEGETGYNRHIILERLADDVQFVALVPPGGAVHPGDEVEFRISVTPDRVPISYYGGQAVYVLTAELPDGLSYIPGSASTVPSGVAGSQVTWNLPVGIGSLANTLEVTYRALVSSSLSGSQPLVTTLTHRVNDGPEAQKSAIIENIRFQIFLPALMR